MKIGIMSGKGGTGKTTISVNLARALKIPYVDCDVEEPNGFIFLKPKVTTSQQVYTKVPIIKAQRCNGCGKCVDFCQFNALMKVGKEILTFPKLCHGCEGCSIICDNEAVEYAERRIGEIEEGYFKVDHQEVKAYRGVLDVGEPMAVPVINELLRSIDDEEYIVVDCAPGTSCNLVNTLEHIDFAVVVCEPTVYGLSDMKRTIDLLRCKGIPFGVVINKWNEEVDIVENFCEENDTAIIGKLPFSKEIATRYSKGQFISENKIYCQIFKSIYQEISNRCEVI